MENTTKPKLLYVITQAEWGGAQKYIFDLATSEEAQNYDITVAIGNTINTTLIDKLADKGIKIHSLKKLIRSINPLKDLSAISELKNLFSTLQPNIIHLNSSKAGIIGSFAYRLWNNINCRLIYTAHGWVFNEPLPNWKKTFYLNLEKNTAKDKNHIICVAQSDQKIATEKGIFPRQNLTTIHNGIDIAEMKLLEKFEARRLLELQPNAYIIGTIANFYPTKGLKYLIEAMYYLDNNYNLPIYL
ncbi:MAG: glycosyltransferase, partial [bacterium]